MFCRSDLEELMQPQRGPCVSLYLPSNARIGHPEKDAIRMKNLLKSAQRQLEVHQMRPVEVKQLLVPAFELVENDAFWRSQSGGVAIFLSQDRASVFSESHRFAENAVVGSRFFLIPLLAVLAENHKFYVLALSQKRIRFFRNRGEQVEELELGGVPRSLADAMIYDEPLKQLQYHSGAPRAGGKSSPVFHGQGTGTDDSKDRILRFLQQVDSGISPLLRHESVPLVVAGVDYLLPIFRKVNTYPHLLEEGLTGNPDDLGGEVLAQKAKEILSPLFSQPVQDALDRFAMAVGTGRASQDVREVALAAIAGRVETLLVTEQSHQWADLDDVNMQVVLHDSQQLGDVELLNECATRTISSGGAVLVVPPRVLPSQGPCLALFRY